MLKDIHLKKDSDLVLTIRPLHIFAADEMATTAILDRLFHKAHILNIDGQSYRLQDFNKMIQESHKEES